ncbi:MAG: GAF domain-containing protein, partial [Anaerolineales bacterium]
MDLLLIQEGSEELLTALNQHPELHARACRDVHEARGLIAAHAPSAVILRPGPQLHATISALKAQAPTLLRFILLDASASEPLADLLQDEDVVPLPLEYVHTAYFPDLARQAVAHHQQRRAASPDERLRRQLDLIRKERTARKFAEMLQQFGAALTSLSDADQVMRTAAAQLGALLPFHALIISLIDDDDDTVISPYTQGLTPETSARLRAGISLAEAPLWEEIIQTGQGILLPRAHEDPRWMKLPGAEELSALIAPLRVRDYIIGFLMLTNEAADFYQPQHLNALQSLADLVAVALTNARLYQSLRRERDQLMALANIDQKILAISDNAAEAMHAILEYALRLMELPKGLIALHHERDHAEDFIYTQNIAREAEARAAILQCWEEGVLARQTDFPVRYPTPERLAGCPWLCWTRHEGAIHAGLSIPLKMRDHTAGVLILLDTRPHTWRNEEVHIARLLAGQTVIALEKALMAQRLKRRLEETQVLNEILKTINSTLNSDKILTLICRRLRNSLRVPLVTAIHIQDATLRLVAEDRAPDYAPQWMRRLTAWEAGSAMHRLLKDKELIRGEDLAALYPDDAAPVSLVIVPLISQGDIIGALGMEACAARLLSAREIDLTRAVAQAVTPALVNAHLHEEMRQAYEQLRHLDAMKSQFIQNVSHELRTPLSIVKGYVDLALGGALGFELTELQQEAIEAIRTHTARVIDIVESITTLEGLEQENLRHLSLSPQAIRPICMTAIQANKQKAMREGLQIIADLPEALPMVAVDARHIVQALGQLLDNAIKFNSKHGKIWMQAAQHGGEVWIQIQDTGAGIPEAEMEKIFNRFYQVDGATNRQYGGMGLGLSIVKEIVDKHRGRIWVESNSDNPGVTF